MAMNLFFNDRKKKSSREVTEPNGEEKNKLVERQYTGAGGIGSFWRNAVKSG